MIDIWLTSPSLLFSSSLSDICVAEQQHPSLPFWHMSCTLVFIRHLLELLEVIFPLKTISYFFDLLKKEVAVSGEGWDCGTC